MKIRAVNHDNRTKAFRVHLGKRILRFPYAKADPVPTPNDPIVRVFADPELGREAFTFELRSGRSGSIHGEQVLDYNADPAYLRDQLLYRLTLEAQRRVERSGLSKRELSRRLSTSPAQLYRLLDPTNYRKSVDKMVELLQALDCDVDFVIRAKSA
jgi:hypothetical protein